MIVLSDLSDSFAAKIGQMIVNLSAIGGAFLFGSLGTHYSVRWASKLAANKEMPPKLLYIMRNLGGVLSAILVGLIVFGSGVGSGLFHPGGSQSHGTNSSTTETKSELPQEQQPSSKVASTSEPKPDPKPVLPPVPDAGKIRENWLRVLVLDEPYEGLSEQFYVIEAERKGYTLGTLKQRIQSLRQAGTPTFEGLLIEVYDDSGTLPREALVQWAKLNQIRHEVLRHTGKRPR